MIATERNGVGKGRKKRMRKRKYMVLTLLLCTFLSACAAGRTIPSDVAPESTAPIKTEKPALETPAPNTSAPEVITDPAAVMGLAEAITERMTLEEKIGQMLLVNFELLDGSKGEYFEFRTVTDEMKQSIQKYHIGGVVFFGRNIENREQTQKFIHDLQESSSVPLYISVDEEGGSVARIASNENMRTTRFPSMEWIGENEDEAYVFDMGTTIGREIKELGFNLDFAPVADIAFSEENEAIGDRSFGEAPKEVGELVAQMVKGLQEQGVGSVLKHFPGHGDAKGDSHEGVANLDKDMNRLRSVEFVPFQAGIKAGADFVMVGHISLSRIAEDTAPASLSELVMQTMLREELQFNGIIITDAMNMEAITERYEPGEAAVLAVKAGADMLLMPQRLDEAADSLIAAVEQGEIEMEQIDRSVLRIISKKIERGLILSDTELVE